MMFSPKTVEKFFSWAVTYTLFFYVTGSASAAIMIDWVDVADPGNPPNPIVKRDETTGYGQVDYTFRISKYETTNSQYADFLNAVATIDTNDLYDISMGSELEGGILRIGSSGTYSYTVKPNMGNKPVNFVSWFDSARFANWFQNGQPTGLQDSTTTEDGAYTFKGLETVGTRNPGAQFYIPNEHEWDKAAFYEPGAITELGDGWWKYPSHSDTFPTVATVDANGNVNNPGLHVVVFREGTNWNGTTNGNVATVGSAGNESYYGARDMTGNVFEWTTADPTKPDPDGWGPYTVRGGSFLNFGHVDSKERNLVHHHNHGIVDRTVGFRLAAASLDSFNADFNDDTLVDHLDLDIWQQAYGNSIAGDANNDGVTNGGDFLIWQRQFSGLDPFNADFNDDGYVDSGDLTLWQNEYGTTYDGSDFLHWQRQFTGSPSSQFASVQVPEPVCWGFVVLLTISAVIVRPARLNR